jgi:hypothetical protein
MTGEISESELAELDIAALLRAGLGGDDSRITLFGDGAVGAAVVLDRLHVVPRSLTYLAEVVRAGGVRAAVALPEPLPHADHAAVIRPWLAAAADTVSTVDGDEDVARWLEAVATLIAARITGR